jgi:3-hydroxyacyl-[acyl-carrier-protein] dehydratase
MDEQPRKPSDMTTIDIMRIMEMIPHRYPFLLIDRVIELKADKHVVGLKNVTINESFFQGHFPRQPVMPGVLIIEAMAQTAAVLVVETLEGAAAGKLVYFMSVEDARFRKPVFPGDTLRIRVEKLRSRANVWKFSARVQVEDRLAAEARFAAMIMDD